MDLVSWASVAIALLTVLLSLMALHVWRRQQREKEFRQMGLSGPVPALFMGNSKEMMTLGIGQSFIDWKKKYGNVFRVFLPSPSLAVMDLDLLREVMVKKFHAFPNRHPIKALLHKPWLDSLLQLRGDHWKHVRSHLSPTFSSGKLKKMMPAIVRVVDNLHKYVGEKVKTEEELELKALTGSFTMDAIAGAAFGLQVDSLANPADPFYINGMAMARKNTYMYMVAVAFPYLISFLSKLGLAAIPMKPTKFFLHILDLALQERRKDNQTYSDFLQLLVDAERKGENQGPIDAEIDHTAHLTMPKEWTRKGLTDDEMKGNGFLFFAAGFDTVSSALSFSLFYLAAHPHILRTVQREIDEKLGASKVDYNNVNDLTYLDMCISETMRLHPPGKLVDREVEEDVEIGGYTMKKGEKVVIPIYAVHRDPEYWPDPDQFLPDRFTAEAKAARHPFAFMPFGMGPRNCIAMRLALLEIRMVVAALLQHYTPVLCDKSVFPPVIEPPQLKATAKDGLWVKFTARD